MEDDGVVWLQCTNCTEGTVQSRDGATYPPPIPGGGVTALPAEIERVYGESRACFAVGAFTACELMCRKILMHLAVDVAGAQPGDTFTAYVDALEDQGYITTGLKPVVDTIRGRGNAATHELPASTEGEARTTLTIVEHLLRSLYEIPGLATP